MDDFFISLYAASLIVLNGGAATKVRTIIINIRYFIFLSAGLHVNFPLTNW